MKKIFGLILSAAVLGTVLTACGGSGAGVSSSGAAGASEPASVSGSAVNSSVYGTTLADIQAKGELVIGLDDTFAPMGFRDESGNLVGFDIDLATAVCEELGVKATFQPIDWDAKEMELSSGNIDCIWNGMSITPEREEAMSLSQAYLNNKIVIMTKEGVAVSAKEDLANYNIGIQAGSAALEAVTNDAVYASIQDKITEYPTYDEVILDVQAGRLDCMIIDEVYGGYKNAKLGSIFAVSEVDFGDDLYAIGFRKGDAELTQAARAFCGAPQRTAKRGAKMNLEYIQAILPALLKGTWQTLQVFFLTLVLSLPLGLPFALGSISRFFPVRFLSKAYIWVFRGTPLMLQLFFVYYGLPIMFGPAFRMENTVAAVLTFTMNYAAYFAEIYRAGVQSIDHGQHEAAKTLGFSRWQTMRIIIIPQTIARVIPPVSNEVITLIKDTALVTAIGVGELLKAAKDANNRDVNPTAFFIAAVIYLALTFLLTLLSQWCEKRFSRHERKEA